MKRIFLFALLCIAIQMRADDFEKNCGIGILHLDFLKQTDLALCSSADEKTVVKHITFTISGDKKNKTATLSSENKENWLAPEFLQPEKLVLALRV
ncbi:MAG: hypothetical protein ACRCYO_05040, partial [Bacteroidia bacterium]